MSISLPFNSNRYLIYLEDNWPGAGGLSAVNAIGTQLRDPMNSGLTRWRMAVPRNKWTSPRKSEGMPRVSTRFSLSMENEQAEAGWDGRTRFARPNSQADHEQDWQPYPVDPYSSKCDGLSRQVRLSSLTSTSSSISTNIRRYFQHAHFIPIVGVGKRGAY